MSGGTAERKGGFGYYNIGGQVIYFNKEPTESDIQAALKKAEAEAETLALSHLNCGGACCVNQSWTIH